MPSQTYTKQQIQQMIVNEAISKNVPPGLALAVAQRESHFDPTSKSPKGAIGVMQLMPDTASYLKVADINDTPQNIAGGVKYLASLLNAFGTPERALAAYNAGPNAKPAVLNSAGVQQYVSDIMDIWQGYSTKPIPRTTATYTLAQDNFLFREDTGTLTPYQKVNGLSYTDNQDNLKALEPVYVIEKGIDELPWYKDSNLITANKARKDVTPVTFRIRLGWQGGMFKDFLERPIDIQLNCSLQNYSKTMEHVYTHTNTRSGVHLTFWGMRPDTISGQGVTGLFINQMGVTDLLSATQASPSVVLDLLRSDRQGFTHALQNPEGFRVAAQDAFVEFLQLFRNNGLTYFFNDQNVGETSQESITAFAAKYGMSVSERKANNHSVMTKGHIVFNMGNSSYSGYFKSLNWNMDANKPFSWNFNFVFQVQKEATTVPQVTTVKQTGGTNVEQPHVVSPRSLQVA